ncbi:spore germination protein GerPE [Virgibacillus doumboii]|uniref:spore germination protein GerPE n=1 Tax=Virgibacillus doumboii TaxID=2697503 RepID=UPI0013DE9CD1|nr:spore germination protein GerPE [Virgibacillus doumboii]
MEKRTASVNRVRIHGVTFSAVFNIGDTKFARPKSRGIAVQKEGASFVEDDDINFEEYALFDEKANWPNTRDTVLKKTFHHSDTLQVDNVDIIGVSQAAIFHIGSIDDVRSEARLKHFRLYLPE